jgi:pimeloyl-ACP methyl ester carboxylesterase
MADRVPLLLLPGLLCDGALWRDVGEELADIAEPYIADLTQDESLEAMARRALAQAPARFALAGLSMGGYLAFEIMRQAPERVTRLALIATSARADSPARAGERERAMAALRLGRFMGVTRQMLPQLVHPDHVDGPVGQEVRAMAARVGPQAFLRQQQAIATRPDSLADLARIAVPTLVIAGEQDRMIPPEQAGVMARGIAGAGLHLLDRCGHLPPMEQPGATARLMRGWLTGGA